MTDARLNEIEKRMEAFIPADEIIAGYGLLLVNDYRDLRAAVVQAMNQVGNLRVTCPELAALVNAKEGP